jgi:hypothetical protein
MQLGVKRLSYNFQLSPYMQGKLVISFNEFEQQWLEEIVEGQPSTVHLGHRFAQKLLRDWHEIDASSDTVSVYNGDR